MRGQLAVRVLIRVSETHGKTAGFSAYAFGEHHLRQVIVRIVQDVAGRFTNEAGRFHIRDDQIGIDSM